MNYQINSKYRKLRHKLQFVVSGITFKFLHLPTAYRVALLSQGVVLSSLYFPWFSERGIEYGIFSRFLWGLGVLLVVGAMFLIFLMFSFRKKERMKQRLGIGVSDAVIFMFFGALQFFLLFLALQFLHSLSFFSKELMFFTAPVFAVCGSLFTLGSGFAAYKASRREILHSLYVENDALSQEELDEYKEILSRNSGTPDKKNMALPI